MSRNDRSGRSSRRLRRRPVRHRRVLARAVDGAFTGTVGVVRDVSERERRQELLTRLQETSRSLMQAPKDARRRKA